MAKHITKRWIAVLVMVLLLAVSAATTAFFTDRVGHSTRFTTASFSADGYKLTRTAPAGPFCAGENVTLTLKESNTGSDDVNSVISMKATWVSPDTGLSIFGNANAADNARLSIDGTNVSYKVSADKKSITFDLPKHVLAARTTNKARALTLNIPAAFRSTGRIDFSFEKVTVMQDPTGFSKAFDRTALNAANTLDCRVRVGWAASSITAQNGKALMGYLTEKNASGKFGIEFEFAFGYSSSPMKDFSSKTDAKWSYYRDKADRLNLVEGMTSIGDYAFPDFELITGLTLPESLVSVGKWSFDNISIPTLTLPAALTGFDAMSFGHINKLTVINFEQADNTDLSFPDAGSATGAFFVEPYAEPTNRTKVNSTNVGALSYDWVADQRKLLPILRSWDPDAGTDFHGLRDRVSNISFTNSFALPAGFDTSAGFGPWDVSDAQDRSVMAYMMPNAGADIISGSYTIFSSSLPEGITGTVVSKAPTWDEASGCYTWPADKVVADNMTVPEWTAGSYDVWSKYFVPDNDPAVYYSFSLHDGESSMLNKYVRAGGYDVIIASNTGWTEDVIANADSDYICNNMLGLATFSDDHLDTGRVRSLRQTFNNCSFLTDCDLSSFDTSRVNNFYGMFNECPSLETLNAVFDTSGVNDAALDRTADLLMALSSDENENGISGGLAHLFDGCEKLTAVDTAAWKLSGAQSLRSAFDGCRALTHLDVGTWDVSNVKNFRETFRYCMCLENIDVSRWQVGSAENMYGMFDTCAGFTTLAVDNWDVSKVKDFGCTFVNCNQLETLNVSDWDTSGAETMSSMFWCCESLRALDVSRWDVSKVKSFYFAFADCPLITEFAAGNWNTGSVETFYHMFAGDEGLVNIDVSRWDTSHADTFDYMFGYCYSLTSLDVSDWVVTGSGTHADGTAKRTLYTSRMFAGTKLTAITLGTGWDELKTTLYGMLYLTDITFEHTASDPLVLVNTPGSRYGLGYVGTSSMIKSSPYNADNLLKTRVHTSNDTIRDIVLAYDWLADYRDLSMDKPMLAARNTWYKGTTAKSAITQIEIVDSYTPGGTPAEAWNADVNNNGSIKAYLEGEKLTIAGKGLGGIAANTDSANAFSGFWNLTSFGGLDLLDTSNVTSMDSMFAYDKALVTLDVSGFDTASVTSMSSMFEGCHAVTGLPVGGFNTALVNNMERMFTECRALTDLDLSRWNTSNVTTMGDTFAYCQALTDDLDLTGWDTSEVTNMNGMFRYCKALTSLDISDFNTSKVTDMGYMFEMCGALPSLDVSGFNTAKVTNMASMFSACSGLTGLELINFDTAQVTSMRNMFGGCTKLAGVNVAGFDTAKVTDMENMFAGCYSLTEVDVSMFNTAQVTDMGQMFDRCYKLISLDLAGWDTSEVTSMRNMFNSCRALQTVVLGETFKFVGSDGYLPAPSASYIPGADGYWYTEDNDTGWTPHGVALVERPGPVTYVAVRGATTLALTAPALMVETENGEKEAVGAGTGAMLEGISVTRAPVKTQYVCGELFDKAGMEVTAVYTDGSTKVIEDYMFVDDRPLTDDMDSVAISYAENDLIKFCKVAVTVMPDEVDEINGGDGGGGHADPERGGAE